MALYNFDSRNGCTTNPSRGKRTLTSTRAGVSRSSGLMTTSSGDKPSNRWTIAILVSTCTYNPATARWADLLILTRVIRCDAPGTKPVILSSLKCSVAGVGNTRGVHVDGW